MNYDELMFQNWKIFNIDFNNEKQQILELLAKEIYVKENKNRFNYD